MLGNTAWSKMNVDNLRGPQRQAAAAGGAAGERAQPQLARQSRERGLEQAQPGPPPQPAAAAVPGGEGAHQRERGAVQPEDAAAAGMSNLV